MHNIIYRFLILLIIAFYICLVGDSIGKPNLDSLYKVLNSSNKEKKLDAFYKIYDYVIKLKVDSSLVILHNVEKITSYYKDDIYLNVLFELAHYHQLEQNKTEFKYYINKTLTKSKEYSNKLFEARAYMMIGREFKENLKFDSSMIYNLYAERIFKSIGYTNDLADINHNLGDIYFHLEMYDKALYYYNLVLNNPGNLKDWSLWRKSVILNDLASICRNLNQFDKALEYFRQSKAHILFLIRTDSAKFHLPNLAFVNSRIANVYHKMNKIDSAYHYISMARNSTIENKYDKYFPDIYIFTGDILCSLGKLDSALINYNIAMNLINKEKDLKDLALIYDGLGKVLYKLGDFKKAYQYEENHSLLILNLKEKTNSGKVLQIEAISNYTKYLNEIDNAKLKTNYAISILILLIILLVIFIYYFRKLRNAYNLLVDKSLTLATQEKYLYSALIDLNIDNINPPELEPMSDIVQPNDIIEITEINEVPVQDNNISEFLPDNEPSLNINDEIPIEDISDSLISELGAKILKYLENNDVIYNPEFSITDLAAALKTNRTYISKAINGFFKQNFHSLINELRVKAVIILLSDKSNHHYTLEAISERVGFTNRSTFSRAFQKFTGCTPSFFLKKIQSETQNN